MADLTYASVQAGTVNNMLVGPPGLQPPPDQPGTTYVPSPPSTVQIGWLYDGTNFSAPPPPVLSQNQLNTYATAYQQNLAAGGVVVNAGTTAAPLEVSCDTGPQALAQLNGLNMMALNDATLTANWVDYATGNVTVLTATNITTMAPLVHTFVQNTYDTLSQVLADIASGKITTTAQIDAAPWPSNGK